MQKDFDAWNTIKKQVDLEERLGFYFQEGDIWWANIGLNIGHEENGKGVESRRPVLVLKKFNNHLAYVIPLTTQFKENSYYVPVAIRLLGENFSLLRAIMLSQSRSMSSKRFRLKIGWVMPKELAGIKEALKEIL